MNTLAIGIDPGVNTGFAVWNVGDQKFHAVETVRALVAMEAVRELKGTAVLHLFVEDCRDMWVPRAQYDAARLQGVGSVKRDVAYWEDFAGMHAITLHLPKPGKYRKATAADFKAWTAWQGRTSEHARAAAMMVYGTKQSHLIPRLS